MTRLFDRIGTNTGHGHAWPRPDGMKARCGGVVLCRECARDNGLVERWRKGGTASPGADHGPIDPALHAKMNALAEVLDGWFNGPDCKPEDKKIGFFLTAFNFDESGRFNYISNADKLDVRAMLKEIIARIEGRMAQTSGSRQ